MFCSTRLSRWPASSTLEKKNDSSFTLSMLSSRSFLILFFWPRNCLNVSVLMVRDARLVSERAGRVAGREPEERMSVSLPPPSHTTSPGEQLQ